MKNTIKNKLFLLEDDSILSDLLKTFLENNNYLVDLYIDGITAYKNIFKERYDAMLLDISVPGMNGLDLLAQIREKKITTPVIIITGNTEDEEEIRSFQFGTNVFHKKPIQTKLLLYQIRSLLNSESIQQDEISFNGLTINEACKTISNMGHEFFLSKNEFNTLKFLIQNVNRVVSKNQIIENLYYDDNEILGSSVDTLMSRLRKKLIDEGVTDVRIVTIRSFGYRLE